MPPVLPVPTSVFCRSNFGVWYTSRCTRERLSITEMANRKIDLVASVTDVDNGIDVNGGTDLGDTNGGGTETGRPGWRWDGDGTTRMDCRQERPRAPRTGSGSAPHRNPSEVCLRAPPARGGDRRRSALSGRACGLFLGQSTTPSLTVRDEVAISG